MKQLVKVPPSSTETTVEITIPDVLPITQTGGTPIDPPGTNLPPIVSAGASQTVILPTSSIILNGTGQDPDGVITGIKWEKVSGGAGTIVNQNSLVTQVTGLVAGNYVFKLSLTDDDGATSSSNTSITVKPAVVDPPVTGTIEGYGSGATGGGGSNVVHITNLSQLQGAIASNKTIIIDVSGTINTGISINNISNLTIDAYTSKQDVTITNSNSDGLTIENSNNIIIRGIRSINNTGDANSDGFNATGSSSNVVFDHCSAYGNTDGNIDLVAASGKNFTVQYCILGKDRQSGNMLITTMNASVHHNLFIGDGAGEGAERNPFAHANYSPKGTQSNPNFDVRNNLIHASGRYASGCGYGAVGNFVNNYYTSNKQGLINLCADAGNCSNAYVAGNFNQPTPAGGNSSPEYTIPTQYRIKMTDAVTAAKAILQSVGTWKKDSYEQGVINSISIGGGGTTNQAPGANAGADKNLATGSTTATLTGIGTDSDGNVASVQWSKVSGSGTIVSPNSSETQITGLTNGSHVFQFKVTDDKGATAVDTVTINVGTIIPPVEDGYEGYTLVFSDHFNKDTDLDPHGHNQYANGFIDYSLKYEGLGSFASRTGNVSSGTRSEVQLNSSSTPLEGVADYFIYYKSFQNSSGHDVQLHPGNNGSGTGFYHVNGKLVFRSVLSGTDTYKDYPFNYTPPLNKWIHVQWYYKWAKSGGYCKIVFDGVTLVDAKNIQVGDGSTPSFKLGQNYWSGSGDQINYDKFDLYRRI